jgi:hypothetical protein
MLVGISSVTANILCRTHNSDLSPLDSCAQQAFTVFRDVSAISAIREDLVRSPTATKPKIHLWRLKTYKIDGKKPERWYLKTLINICYDQDHAIGRDSSNIGKPSVAWCEWRMDWSHSKIAQVSILLRELA